MRSFHMGGSRRRGRGWALGARAALAALAVSAAALVTGPPGALGAGPCGTSGQFSQSGATATCTYTNAGTEDTFTVPAGIGTVSVTAVGAQGGAGINANDPNGSSGSGGLGARVSNAALPVTPGAGLWVDVGGSRGPQTGCKGVIRASAAALAASFDGGTDGFCSGPGGGSSALLTAARASATLNGNAASDSRLLVAGGGGGGGQLSNGGSAGNPAVKSAGGGGCASNGGPGGVGPTDGTDGSGAGGCLGGNCPGTAGTAAMGGAGAVSCFGGGGGGGGWFGGGGGGGDGNNNNGGGGGGGSSYGGAGPSGGISIATASSTDAPQVVISWTVPAPTPELSGLKLTPHRFHAEREGHPIGGGTTIHYHNTVAGHTTFEVLRCTTRHGHTHCTRLVGSFSHQDQTGENHLHFTGRLHGHALKAGHYLLRAVTMLGGQTSHPVTASFVILSGCHDQDHDGDCDAQT